MEELPDSSPQMGASMPDDPRRKRLRRTNIGVLPPSAGASRAAGALPMAAFAAFVLMFPQTGLAEPAHPFAKFLGRWRGSGQVVGVNGGSERINCRANYSALQEGAALSQTLVCASDSYRIDIRSNVVAAGQQVQGHWEETTRQATGDLVGHIANGAFEGDVTGPGFTAAISLRAVGRRQYVDIQAQGGDIAKVEINLSRDADR
jgi:hypothetical protein